MLNLLSNAVKFQSSGIIKIQAEVNFKDFLGELPMLEVFVWDQGIGMSEEE